MLLPIFALGSIAFFIAPFALRLSQSSQPTLISQQMKAAARTGAAIAVMASNALSYMVEQPVSRALTTLGTSQSSERLVLHAFASLLSAVPYIPLFIALSLIASQQLTIETDIDPLTKSSDLRRSPGRRNKHALLPRSIAVQVSHSSHPNSATIDAELEFDLAERRLGKRAKWRRFTQDSPRLVLLFLTTWPEILDQYRHLSSFGLQPRLETV